LDNEISKMNVLLPWRPISGIQGTEAGLAINGEYSVWMLHANEGIGQAFHE
jgi:hypothetical protein